MTYGSLFSGIGGMDLGFMRAGLECRWLVEIDRKCRRMLGTVLPFALQHDDARTFPDGDIERYRVDLIAGGDPCQENSRARRGDRCRHPSLGGEFVRILDVLRPRFVLRENPTRVRADAPWPWQRFRSELEGLGYAVLPFRLRSCCFGAGHQRDRMFLLAELADADRIGPRRQEAARRREDSDRLVAVAGRCVGTPPDARRGRGDDGIPSRVERRRWVGNAIDPRVAEFIGRRFLEAVKEPTP